MMYENTAITACSVVMLICCHLNYFLFAVAHWLGHDVLVGWTVPLSCLRKTTQIQEKACVGATFLGGTFEALELS